MSSESDYLLERIPTNASKEKSPLPSGRFPEVYINEIKNSWVAFIHFIGRHYIAEFLATFVLMVSSRIRLELGPQVCIHLMLVGLIWVAKISNPTICMTNSNPFRPLKWIFNSNVILNINYKSITGNICRTDS